MDDDLDGLIESLRLARIRDGEAEEELRLAERKREGTASAARMLRRKIDEVLERRTAVAFHTPPER